MDGKRGVAAKLVWGINHSKHRRARARQENMMSKEEHINYWIRTAEDDWGVVTTLFEAKKYVQCLFFAHLVLEKWCKAHWVKDNVSNIPPKIHNLVKLVEATSLNLEQTDLDFLRSFNDFQTISRYPDYQFEMNKRFTDEYAAELLEKVKTVRKCLQEKL